MCVVVPVRAALRRGRGRGRARAAVAGGQVARHAAPLARRRLAVLGGQLAVRGAGRRSARLRRTLQRVRVLHTRARARSLFYTHHQSHAIDEIRQLSVQRLCGEQTVTYRNCSRSQSNTHHVVMMRRVEQVRVVGVMWRVVVVGRVVRRLVRGPGARAPAVICN